MSTATIKPASVRKSLLVKADPTTAFSAFTARIGNWWPRQHSIGSSPQAQVIIEPRAGGRWYEIGSDGAECEWGKVLAWEPPGRVVLAWQIGSNWKYDPTLVTEVEITFVARGAETEVNLEHRNIERFGVAADAQRAALDSPRGWSMILGSYAADASS